MCLRASDSTAQPNQAINKSVIAKGAERTLWYTSAISYSLEKMKRQLRRRFHMIPTDAVKPKLYKVQRWRLHLGQERAKTSERNANDS